ncbi:MAG TPA: AMP nucleosidase, partial [Sphingomicrobium sp.]
MTTSNDIPGIVDELCALYDRSVGNLRDALTDYVQGGTTPDAGDRAGGCFAYPELRISYNGERSGGHPTRAFARLTQRGSYASSIARPALFRDYLETQLQHLVRDYSVDVSVGRSRSEIPYAYVLDGSGIDLGDITAAELSRAFPSNELSHIGDEIADGVWDYARRDSRPLALFDGPRTDFSLARLRHYTGTSADHFQHFVLFTNYVRYVDEFVRFAIEAIRAEGSPYQALSVPGGYYERGHLADAEAQIAAG